MHYYFIFLCFFSFSWIPIHSMILEETSTSKKVEVVNQSSILKIYHSIAKIINKQMSTIDFFPTSNISNQCLYAFKCLYTFTGHTKAVSSAVFNKDETRVLFASFDKTIELWDTKTGNCLCTTGHTKAVSSNVVFNKDETRVLSASFDHTIKLWDTKTGKCLCTLTGHTASITSAIFNKDETRVLSTSFDKTLKLWDTKTGKCLFTGHTASVASAIFNKDETLVLSASVDDTIKLWDTKTGKCLCTLTGHTATITSAIFNKDETRVLSASFDHTIKLWDTKTGNCLCTFTGHTASVTSAIFNKDETYVLSYSFDKTIKLWDTKTGKCLCTLTGHTASITSAIFNKDETYVLSYSRDNTIKIWLVGDSRALNLAASSLLANSLSLLRSQLDNHPSSHRLETTYFTYLTDNNLTKKLKEAVHFICNDKHDPYEALSMIYFYILQYIPFDLQSRVLHQFLTIKPFQLHIEAITAKIKLILTAINCTTREESKLTIEHMLQQHLPKCISAFILHRFAMQHSWNELTCIYTELTGDDPIKYIGFSLNDHLLLYKSKKLFCAKKRFSISEQENTKNYDFTALSMISLTENNTSSWPAKEILRSLLHYRHPLFVTDQDIAYLINDNIDSSDSLLKFLQSTVFPQIPGKVTQYVISPNGRFAALAATHPSIKNKSYCQTTKSLYLFNFTTNELSLISNFSRKSQEPRLDAFDSYAADIKLKRFQFSNDSTLLAFVFTKSKEPNSLYLLNLAQKRYDVFDCQRHCNSEGFRPREFNPDLLNTLCLYNIFNSSNRCPSCNQKHDNASSKYNAYYPLEIAPSNNSSSLVFTNDDRFLLLGELAIDLTTKSCSRFCSTTPHLCAISSDDSVIACISKDGIMQIFKKESFAQLCLKQAIANTLNTLKHVPPHDHQQFEDAHALTTFDKLLKTNTSLTQLSGLKISLSPSLTQSLAKNHTAPVEPDSFPALESEAPKKHLYTGLAIDSGFMHTLIPAVVLRTIEEKYKVEIHKLFNCIGGSGFGALIALGLTATRDDHKRCLDPQTLVDLFYKHSKNILVTKDSNGTRYNPDNFKKIVRSYFSGLNLSDVLTHVIIPCSKKNPTKPFMFDSLEAQKSLAFDFQMQNVAQAACADEFYFPTVTFADSSCTQKATYQSFKPPYNPANYVYEKLLIKTKNNTEHIRLLSLGASFFINPDHENELKISEIDSYLKEKLGDFSYRRLMPQVPTAQETLKFGDQDDVREELFKLYTEKAEKLIEDNNFIRRLVESKE